MGGCCRHHECTCLDLVGDDGIFRSVELWYAFDTDDVSTCALDIGSHTVKEVGQVYDMGLFGCIFYSSLAGCHAGCHHDVYRSSYGNLIHKDMVAGKVLCVSDDGTVLYLYSSAESFKSL